MEPDKCCGDINGGDINNTIGHQRWLLGKCREALIWCSGSQDFALGGQARKGWEKDIIPLLEKLKKF